MEQSLPKVALDTSMLLAMFESTVDIFDEIKGQLGKVDYSVPQQVVNELKMLEGKNQKMRVVVGVVLQLLEKKEVKIVETEGKDGDEALFVGRNEFTINTRTVIETFKI